MDLSENSNIVICFTIVKYAFHLQQIVYVGILDFYMLRSFLF